MSSMATDMEEFLVDEYPIVGEKAVFNIKEYYESQEKETRWSVDFTYLDVHYTLLITGLEEAEMKKIVENLYFS